MSQSPSSLPSENFQRGVIFAFIVFPLGIVVWDILWSVGFVASIVAFGVAWGAVRLYRLGSGGRITRSGAIAVAAITIVTLVLAYVSGFIVDVVQALVKQGASVGEALSYPPFWGYVGSAMTTSQALIGFLLALVFGALGCFSVLRGAFRMSRMPQDGLATNPRNAQTDTAPPTVLGTAPGTPATGTQAPGIPTPGTTTPEQPADDPKL